MCVSHIFQILSYPLQLSIQLKGHLLETEEKVRQRKEKKKAAHADAGWEGVTWAIRKKIYTLNFNQIRTSKDVLWCTNIQLGFQFRI